MSIAISIPVAFIFIIRLFRFGYEKAFEHVTLLELPLFFLGIVLFSAVFSLLIAFAIKYAYITIHDGNITGKNYWYFKRTIPISKITSLYFFSNNGIEAIVADGGSYGKVYISTHTDKLEDLIEYLETHSGCTFDA